MERRPTHEIARYLRTGEHDVSYTAWPASTFLDRATLAHDALRRALVREVNRRTESAIEPRAVVGLDTVAYTRAKVAPMVRGLFPRAEQAPVLGTLERSVIFLTPSNIATILTDTRWHGTAWTLANVYLGSMGVKRLSEDEPWIVGLSEETTCFVSTEYFEAYGRFEDFVVHEAAHIFHNCKRGTLGLKETRRREWLLPIEFAKRETFAYACEAYSRIRELGHERANRLRLLDELQKEPMPATEHVDLEEYVDILRDAVTARNGWKRILTRCSTARSTHRPALGAA